MITLLKAFVLSVVVFFATTFSFWLTFIVFFVSLGLDIYFWRRNAD